jgi:hypothetical protein
VSLCGTGVRAPSPEAPAFDPLHPVACRRCIAALGRLTPSAGTADETPRGRPATSNAA